MVKFQLFKDITGQVPTTPLSSLGLFYDQIISILQADMNILNAYIFPPITSIHAHLVWNEVSSACCFFASERGGKQER